MRWRDALFAHWAVDPAVVERQLPDGLSVATHRGDAYLGVVPFEMTSIRPRGSPVGVSFPELNLRTYVERDGERGVHFFSLDADDRLGVALARRLFELPYYRAEMRVERRGDAVRLTSRRTHSDAPPARFDATYRPTGPAERPEPGSLAAFLTENYQFFADGDRLYCGRIHHDPWSLQPATVEIEANSLFEAAGFDRPTGAPIVHYAAGADVTAGPIRPV
jgi:hypothetical protein